MSRGFIAAQPTSRADTLPGNARPPRRPIETHDEGAERHVTTYAYSSESPADVKAGLLIVPVFQGPKPGPGVRETGLAKAYADAKLTGQEG